MTRLSGNRCRCAACGRTFSGLSYFERHRYFTPGTDTRACRDDAWLAEHGITQRDTGIYAGPRLTDEQRAERGFDTSQQGDAA